MLEVEWDVGSDAWWLNLNVVYSLVQRGMRPETKTWLRVDGKRWEGKRLRAAIFDDTFTPRKILSDAFGRLPGGLAGWCDAGACADQARLT